MHLISVGRSFDKNCILYLEYNFCYQNIILPIYCSESIVLSIVVLVRVNKYAMNFSHSNQLVLLWCWRSRLLLQLVLSERFRISLSVSIMFLVSLPFDSGSLLPFILLTYAFHIRINLANNTKTILSFHIKISLRFLV